MRARLWLAYGIFSLSGAAGLIYQSIWTQYLGLYLGHAAYAQSLVLAIFMGGMALGSWLASRPAASAWNLLRSYALIELVIAVFGAVFHWEFVGLTNWAYSSVIPALGAPAAVTLFKWSSGALLILPQTVLLGMTFPLMSNGLMRWHREGDGAVLSTLYFTNSIGAAIGALVATFVLLPASGMPGTLRFAAAIGLLVAGVGAWLGSAENVAAERPVVAGAAPSALPRGSFLLAAAFITGASSFVYEVGWVRMLSLVFGATSHTFELMLAAFIAGLAFGGLWIRKRIDAYADAIRVGGFVQLLMGLAALLSLLCYDKAFDWVLWVVKAVGHTDASYALYSALTALGGFLLMAPAAFFAGMTLPLFTLALRRLGGGERSVGHVYAANTLGAIFGVLIAVHLLLPYLGLKLMMIIGAAADLLLGLALLRTTAGRDSKAYIGGMALGAAALVAVLLGARFDPMRLGAGFFRNENLLHAPGSALYYRDGKTASVSLIGSADGSVSIRTNGKADAAIQMRPGGPRSEDELTMVMAGALPWAFRDNLKDVAVVGFGSGLTTNTLLRNPGLARVDTIEIEPKMVEAARLFGEHVQLAYSDPRSHVHYEDAKSFMAASQRRYDVIVSEPSNPWVSGVASLFTREFYQQAKSHLQPQGLFVQWIQLYEITDELVAAIANTLGEEFADYAVYQSNVGDIIIVATQGVLGAPNHQRLYDNVGVSEVLKGLWMATADEFALHRVGDKHMLASFFRSVSQRRTSDYFPFVSLEAPKARLAQAMATELMRVGNPDLPIGEMLGALAPPAPTSRPIRFDSFLEIQKDVFGARTLLADALGQSSEFSRLAKNLAGQFSLLRGGKGGCTAPLPEGIAIAALRDLARQTVQYLPREMAVLMWEKPDWATCLGNGPAAVALLRVVQALSARDAEAVWQSGQEAMNHYATALDSETLDYVFRATLLGGIVSGHQQEIEAIGARFTPRLDAQDATNALMRQWLIELAKEKAS